MFVVDVFLYCEYVLTFLSFCFNFCLLTSVFKFLFMISKKISTENDKKTKTVSCFYFVILIEVRFSCLFHFHFILKKKQLFELLIGMFKKKHDMVILV